MYDLCCRGGAYNFTKWRTVYTTPATAIYHRCLQSIHNLPALSRDLGTHVYCGNGLSAPAGLEWYD